MHFEGALCLLVNSVALPVQRRVRRGRMSESLVPPNIEALVPYQPGKPIEELERELGIRNAIKLASNENPLGVSPKALAAAQEAVLHINRYPDGSGFKLRQKISKKYNADIDEVVLGNGSVDLIELMVRTFVGPDEEGIISKRTFMSYSCSFQTMGRKLNEVEPIGFRHHLDAIADAINEKTKLILIANPDNPSGTYVTRAEMDRFFARVPARVIVVLDEAYFEFVRAQDFPDGLTYRSRHNRLVVMRTFAKAHGLAGLRVGYAITTKDIAKYLHRTRLPFNVNLVAQAAACAAIDDEEFVQKSRDYCFEALDFLQDGLTKLGIAFIPTQTNFLFVDVEKDGTQVYQDLLREGVITRPMKAYGYSHHLRISIGLPEENRRLLAALQKVMRIMDS
jgi:histidinol-phosphate aminotransferase